MTTAAMRRSTIDMLRRDAVRLYITDQTGSVEE
jgi:hypothetical protein